MDKSAKLTLDQLLFAAAFIAALVIRLLRLAHAPLADSEATLALQALKLADGTFGGKLSGQPGYILPTTALFAIFGAGNALARFIPALAGAGLALMPAFFKKELGRWTALILAFGFALDPGLTALSRQASSFTWAVLFSCLIYVGLKNQQAVLAGVSVGLALLAGAPFWHGLLGVAFGYGLFEALSQGNKSKEACCDQVSTNSPAFWKRALLATLASLLLAGSLFLFIPKGISATGNGLIEYLAGWSGERTGGGFFSLRVIALVVYETFALVFAVFQVVRVIFSRVKQKVDLVLIFWWFAAILLGLLYPAQGEIQLGWALIPMWGLAARWLAEAAAPNKLEQRRPAGILAAVLFILVISTFFSLAGLQNADLSSDEGKIHWMWAVGALMLALAGVLLVRWGWSSTAAVYGIVWALTASLALWSISALFSSAGLAKNPESQLWRPRPAVYEGDLLLKSIGDFSEWNTGLENTLDLAVVDISSPALEWALRDYDKARFYNVLPVGTSPSMVLTREQASPLLAEYYRGQDFIWQAQPAWTSMLPRDWVKWAIYKTASLESDIVVFWVRTDRFPGSGEDQGE